MSMILLSIIICIIPIIPIILIPVNIGDIVIKLLSNFLKQ